MMENNRFLSKFWNLKSVGQQQQNEVGSKTPSFKPSLFTSNTSLQKDNPSTSSFYSGNVQFGGAMSAKHTASPYVVSQAKKISVASKKYSQSSKSLKGSLSSTARKIFQTLEKMSTPLHDVKRIPPPSKNTSFFGRYNRKRPLGATFFYNSKKACPPSAGRASMSVSENTSASLPLDNSLATHTIVQNLSANSKTESPSKIIYKGKPGVLASLSSSSGIKLKMQANKPATSGGKMKSQKKSFGHYVASSKDTFENDIEAPNLPDITLNITSLPDFDFKKSDSTSTPAHPKFSSKELKNEKDILESQYKFALPTSVSLDKRRKPKETLLNEVQFASQSALPKHKHSETKYSSLLTSQKKPTLKTRGSVMDILGKKTADPTKVQEKPSSLKPSIGELFKKPSNQWECEVCMVVNDNEKLSCEACTAPNPSSKPLVVQDNFINDVELTKCEAVKPGTKTATATTSETKGFSSNVATISAVDSASKFSFGVVEPSAGTKNRANESNVLSVQTNTTAADAKVKAKPLAIKNADRWACDVGLIHNDKDKEKYPACENRNPLQQKVETSSAETKFESKFKFEVPSVTSKWVCNICLVPNDPERPSCIACNGPNSQAEKSEVSAPPAFKFGSTSSNMLQVGSSKLFGEANPPAPNTFTPTLVAETKLGSLPLSDFKFGTSSSCSGAVVASENLQVVSSTENLLTVQSSSSSVTFAFGSQASQEDSVLPHSGKLRFQFQAPSSEKKQTEKISQPASSVPLLPASKDHIPSRNAHESLPEFSKSARGCGTSMTPTTALSKQSEDISIKTTNSLLGKEQDDTNFSNPPAFSGFGQEEKQVSIVESEPNKVTGNVSFGTTDASGSALAKDAKPMFSFGSSKTAAQKNSSNPMFGSTKTILQENRSEATNAGANIPLLGFGRTNNAASDPDVMDKPSSLSGFDQTSALKSDQPNTKTSAFVGFGRNASISEKRNGNIDQASKFGGFGPSTGSSGQSTFSFGQSTSAVSETKSTFSFGQSSGNSTSSLTKSGFSFGSSAVPKDSPSLPQPTFGFGTPAPAAFGNNVFGNPAQLPAPPTTQTGSRFQFGSSNSTQPHSNPMFGGAQTSSKPLFSFGSNASESAKTSGFQFGGQQNNAPNAFNFGSNANKNPTPSAGFHSEFSAPTKPTFSTAPKIPFQFGSNQSQAKPDSTTNTGFQFNVPQQQPNPFTPNALSNAGSSAMFSIGQTGKSTPNRAVKVAKRRLKK